MITTANDQRQNGCGTQHSFNHQFLLWISASCRLAVGRTKRLSFDPCHVGDTYTKKTLLWGRMNADLPIAPVEPTEGSKMHSKYGGKSLATKNARSATPEGFAYAFFLANNAEDQPAMAIAYKYDRLDRQIIEQAVASGVSESDIDNAVADFYYMDLDDDAANEAIRSLMDGEADDDEQGQRSLF